MNVEDRILIKTLAHTADIVNTINGGMSQPNIDINKGEDEWTVRLRIPGVSAEKVKVEVKDNQLFIFHMMTENNHAKIQLPYLLTMVSLNSRVDLDGIVAEYENSELCIHLPMDGSASGYEREIEIFRR